MNIYANFQIYIIMHIYNSTWSWIPLTQTWLLNAKLKHIITRLDADMDPSVKTGASALHSGQAWALLKNDFDDDDGRISFPEAAVTSIDTDISATMLAAKTIAPTIILIFMSDCLKWIIL